MGAEGGIAMELGGSRSLDHGRLRAVIPDNEVAEIARRRLVELAQANDYGDSMRELLEAGVSVHQPSTMLLSHVNSEYPDKSVTLLELAVLQGNLEGVKLLVQHGGDLHGDMSWERSLWYWCAYGAPTTHMPVVEYLLEKGVRLPEHFAFYLVERGCRWLLVYLLVKGHIFANTRKFGRGVTDDNGLPLVIYAVEYGRLDDIALVLIDHTSEVARSTYKGMDLMTYAIRHQRVDVLRRLLDMKVPIPPDALKDACTWTQIRRLEILQLLIQHGARVGIIYAYTVLDRRATLLEDLFYKHGWFESEPVYMLLKCGAQFHRRSWRLRLKLWWMGVPVPKAAFYD